ncbi:MAG TPA: ATP synthase F0 subunit B [Candidatus Acidoferrales bacterium]|nr:ATP synthase F0 subunit B [Candidatus Acidoferrales bacterium]
MDQTLRQVGELLLGAIPTAVLLLMLYAIYHALVHKPLEAVMAERRDRTEGAIDRARADIAAAEAKATEYETRLREAKVAIFKAQEARRAKAQQARAEAVAKARSQADQQVRAARQQMLQEVDAAKATLGGEAERLAGEILRTILQPASAGRAPVAG